MADIIDLMLATGCRIGEILALRWSDLTSVANYPSSRCRDDQDLSMFGTRLTIAVR